MTRKLANADALIAEMASRQHGVVCTSQLIECGVAEHAIRSRVTGRRLHRVHQGVYAVGHSALSAEGRLMAAVLAVGRGSREPGTPLDHWGAAVSRRSAAGLWQLLQQGEGEVDVVVRGGGGRARRRGIRVHRSVSLRPSEVTLLLGIPVTTPARTIADLRAANAAHRPGALRDRELRQAIRQANVLSLPLGEAERSDRSRSDLEADFLELCRRHGFPAPDVNVALGPYLVDFLWRRRRLVVETDAYRYHRGQTAFRDDRRRDLELRSLGYEVIRLSEQQVNEEPERVAETLAALLTPRSGGK